MATLSCQVCNSSYNFFTKHEHLCRRCRRSVCATCSNFRTKVHSSSSTTPQVIHSLAKLPKVERVCKLCKPDQD